MTMVLHIVIASLLSVAAAADGAVDNADPVLRALRMRDGVACADLPADPDLAAKLHLLAEADVAPAAVPLRAAACLTERFSADPRFLAWVTPWFSDEDRGGLAFAVLSTGVARPALTPLVERAPASWQAAFARALARPERAATP